MISQSQNHDSLSVADTREPCHSQDYPSHTQDSMETFDPIGHKMRVLELEQQVELLQALGEDRLVHAEPIQVLRERPYGALEEVGCGEQPGVRRVGVLGEANVLAATVVGMSPAGRLSPATRSGAW